MTYISIVAQTQSGTSAMKYAVTCNRIALIHLLSLQNKVKCVAQYELISHSSDDDADGLVDRHGSIDATVQWNRHSHLLQEPPLDVVATLVRSTLLIIVFIIIITEFLVRLLHEEHRCITES